MERVGVKQTQLNAPVHPQPSDAHSISYVWLPYGLDFEQAIHHATSVKSFARTETKTVQRFIDTWVFNSENATTVKSKDTKPYIVKLGHLK